MCKGITGFLFGHNFEPRYDIYEKKVGFQDNGYSLESSGMFSNFSINDSYPKYITTETGEIPIDEYKRTYHYDICTRCGEKIKRGD
jgi:hypothetical protein